MKRMLRHWPVVAFGLALGYAAGVVYLALRPPQPNRAVECRWPEPAAECDVAGPY